MVRNSALDCRAGGVRVRVPFFQPISPTEEKIESNSTWGTSGAGYLTPQKITADEQIMTIMHRGFSYAVDDLSSLGSGSDPMAAIRSYLTKAILKLRTSTLIAQVDGLFDTALTDNVVAKCSGSTVPDESNYLTAQVFAEARAVARRAWWRHHSRSNAQLRVLLPRPSRRTDLLLFLFGRRWNDPVGWGWNKSPQRRRGLLHGRDG